MHFTPEQSFISSHRWHQWQAWCSNSFSQGLPRTKFHFTLTGGTSGKPGAPAHSPRDCMDVPRLAEKIREMKLCEMGMCFSEQACYL